MTRTFYIFLLCFSACTTEPFSIEKFTHPEGERHKLIFEGKAIHETERHDYFMVTGNTDSKSVVEKIKRFVNENRDSLFNKYRYYSMSFFRKSQPTNQENLNAFPRDFVRYSVPEDLFLAFEWEKGRFVSMRSIKDCYTVWPEGSGTITIEDVQ